MRVLHSAVQLAPSSGITAQMLWEQQAANNLGLDWDVRMYCSQGSSAIQAPGITQFSLNITSQNLSNPWRKASAWLRLRRDYNNWLSSIQVNYDVILLRYSVHDPFQWAFVKQCPKPVYLVHHTLETPELASSGGFIGNLRAKLELLMGKQTITHAAGIIGVTKEITEYERTRADASKLDFTVYPNGISFTEEIIEDNRTHVPEFLFVASSFASWHGLDLLLAAAASNSSQFVLHLVGDVSSVDRTIAKKDKRVRIHDQCTPERIQEIASSCWLGLSSFALHRKGMEEACTLKVREYLMMGLPVYAGYQDVFPDDFPYYMNGGLDFNSLMSYAKSHCDVNRYRVSQVAYPYIDKKELLRALSKFLDKS